jgi:hypothetical protein
VIDEQEDGKEIDLDDDMESDTNSNAEVTEGNEHDVLFRVQRVTDLQSATSSLEPNERSKSAPQTDSQTPCHQRLRNALKTSTPLQHLVSASTSDSLAKIPKCVYLRPTTNVRWTALPQPAVSLGEENDMLRNELSRQNNAMKSLSSV